MKSAKHTQLPVVPADCQLEGTQHHNRTMTVPSCGVSTPMINNCTSVNNDSRHHQLISDQEPPDGDETDPDVIPNQYGKCNCTHLSCFIGQLIPSDNQNHFKLFASPVPLANLNKDLSLHYCN